MLIKEFSFMEASPLLAFIEKCKDKIVGKEIKRFYSSSLFGGITDDPVVFEFDEFSLILHYFFYSDITIQIVAPQLVHEDNSLSFLYRGIPESCNLRQYVNETPFPYIDVKIVDVTVQRFAEEFEINGATGETRPEGGDYFKVITVHLEGGRQFYICGEDAIVDGYMVVWD